MTALSLIPLLMLAAVPAKAPSGCERTAPHAEDARESLIPLFYSADDAAQRGRTIRRLAASDSSYVVRDDSVCDRIVPLAVGLMRAGNTVWAARKEGNYRATVFRFGPYYVVALGEELPPVALEKGVLSGVQTGRSVTLVFSAEDLRLVQGFY